MTMCRKIFLILMAAILCISLQGQNREEWTEQNKTKIKRVLEQIAANKVYIEIAQEGLKIISEGLSFIRSIKDGDFRMHLNYIDSRSVVKPEIKYYANVQEIISIHQQILKIAKRILKSVSGSAEFKGEEKKYCKDIVDILLRSCLENINELVKFAGVPGVEITGYQMTDDERIQCIDKLLKDMQEKNAFLGAFANEINMLAIQRLADKIEINHSKAIR